MKPSKELLVTIGVTVLCFLIMVPSRIIAPVWEFAKKEVNEGYNIRVQSFIGMLPLYQYSFYHVENTLPQESRAFLNMILNAVEAEDILVADGGSFFAARGLCSSCGTKICHPMASSIQVP